MLEFLTPSWTKPRTWQVTALAKIMDWLGQMTPEYAVYSAIMGAGKSHLICELAACTKLGENEVIVVSTSTESLVNDLYHDLRKRCGQYKSVGQWYGRRKRMAQIVVVCVPSMRSFADAMHMHGKTCALWIADEVHRSECATVIEAAESLKAGHALGLTATAFRSDEKESITLFKHMLGRYGVKDALDDRVVVPWRIVNYQGVLDDADEACLEMIKASDGPGLTNADSIKDADDFAKYLSDNGVPARSVHSKLPPHARAKMLDDLKSGAIRCVVHVNLLTEGANYPWLMWLTLRREVESRVRFCQEAGRGLRSFDGQIWGKLYKHECVFNDPHDQFGSFDLSYDECLGEAPPKVELPFDVSQPAECVRKISEADPPVAMAAIESAVRSIAVACITGGIMGDRKPIKKADRLKPSNDLQRVVLRRELKMSREFIPDGWNACLDAITERPECVRYGFAADLISALNGIRAAKRWPSIDTEGRISGMVGESESEPTPIQPAEPGQIIKMNVDDDGQTEIDFSNYCEARRSESLKTWTEA